MRELQVAGTGAANSVLLALAGLGQDEDQDEDEDDDMNDEDDSIPPLVDVD